MKVIVYKYKMFVGNSKYEEKKIKVILININHFVQNKQRELYVYVYVCVCVLIRKHKISMFMYSRLFCKHNLLFKHF